MLIDDEFLSWVNSHQQEVSNNGKNHKNHVGTGALARPGRAMLG
jgi:hypothetical protein